MKKGKNISSVANAINIRQKISIGKKMCKLSDNNHSVKSMFSPTVKNCIEKHCPGLPSKRLLSQIKTQTNDAACLTDLCSSEVAEVEIISLLEEQIPKYKIRADKIVSFTGVLNQDFNFQFPALQIPEVGLGLSNDQIRETLNYFLLSGERMDSVVRCYDDIEAVTRLLQEKEKDLELTVQIGKELLTKNIRLEKKLAESENYLKVTQEQLAQVNHELTQKNELINILTENDEPSSSEIGSPPSVSKSINFDCLQKKINFLETENRTLHSEVLQVVKETDEVEEHERRLINELSEQLSSTHYQFEHIGLELERYKEENKIYNEQIINLTYRLSEAELRLHQVLTENEETFSLLSVTKENQNLLTTELAEYKMRYQETLNVLQETQETLKVQKKRSQPMMRSSYIPGVSHAYNPDSLKFELELMESSMFSESSVDSGIHSENGSQQQHQLKPEPIFKKAFETVKCASNSSAFKDIKMDEISGLMALPRMSCSVYSTGSSEYSKSNERIGSSSLYSSIYGPSIGFEVSTDKNINAEPEETYQSRTCPGVPGAVDLEQALMKLTSAEILSRRAMLSHAPAGTYCYDDPQQIRTPESVLSGLTSQTTSTVGWRLPKKLEIVKPIEGSYTLNHWNRLATPTMGNLLHDNPNIKVKGEKTLNELGMQLHYLDDLEEDFDDHPVKQISSSCIYTFTNSTVMHPDDGTASITFSLPPSQVTSRMESTINSRQTTAPSTPKTLSRRNSCSTFSVHQGLASMLNERGIKAVTPSCFNTPMGQNFSPTITPCNSPTDCSSPHRPASPEAQTITSFLTSSAGLLRKKIIGEQNLPPSLNTTNSNNNHKNDTFNHLEKKAKIRSIRILERVENLGLENIIATSTSSSCGIHPLSLNSSNIYTRYNSPMLQLTSLKHLTERNKITKDSNTNKLKLSDEASISTTTTTSLQIAIDSKMKQRIHRQKSRRSLNGSSGQRRPDLGTVKIENEKMEEKSLVGGLYGSISSLLFGRKGGLQ